MPGSFPGSSGSSGGARRRTVITARLCGSSLTRVLGSVTLAIDKARKGAWSEVGKGSAAHTRGKPG